MIRQNFYRGQKVEPKHLNDLQSYTENYNAELISGVIGYGIVYGFEVSNNDMIVEVTSGLAYTQQGVRLESAGKNITIADSEKPTVDTRTLKLSLRHSYEESNPQLDTAGVTVNTEWTPTVELIVGEIVSEQDLYIADILLNSSGIYQIATKNIQFTTIPQQKETTDALTAHVNSMIQKNGSETNIVGSVININDRSLADTIRDLIYPIRCYYTQYPNSITNDFPDNETPAVLFGGDWEPCFNNEGVFFRTGGGNAEDPTIPIGGGAGIARTSGIQKDAVQRFTGNLEDITAGDYSHGLRGVFNSTRISSGFLSFGSDYQKISINIDNSRSVQTAQENRPINRLIKVWQRIA